MPFVLHLSNEAAALSLAGIVSTHASESIEHDTAQVSLAITDRIQGSTACSTAAPCWLINTRMSLNSEVIRGFHLHFHSQVPALVHWARRPTPSLSTLLIRSWVSSILRVRGSRDSKRNHCARHGCKSRRLIRRAFSLHRLELTSSANRVRWHVNVCLSASLFPIFHWEYILVPSSPHRNHNLSDDYLLGPSCPSSSVPSRCRQPTKHPL
jgi:hypothetical protein